MSEDFALEDLKNKREILDIRIDCQLDHSFPIYLLTDTNFHQDNLSA